MNNIDKIELLVFVAGLLAYPVIGGVLTALYTF